MKTTIEIPEPLFRQAKAKAAMEGLTLRDLFVRGLQLAVQTSSKSAKQHAAFPLIRAAKVRRASLMNKSTRPLIQMRGSSDGYPL